jgi:hypothetical protein
MSRLQRMLRSVWSKPRPLDLVFAGLVLAVVFLYVPLRLTFGAAPVEANHPEPTSVVITDPVWPFRTDDVDDDGRLLVPESVRTIAREGYDPRSSHRRNLFAYGTPPRTSTPVRRPSTPRPTPGPRRDENRTPPPPPWNCPLSLLGLGSHPYYKIAWFKDEAGSIYVAAEGSEVDVYKDDKVVARCRVDRIDLDKVQLANPSDSNQTRTVKLEEKK